MEAETVFKKNIEWRLRLIAQKPYLLSRYKTFELNQIGAIIWQLLDEQKTLNVMIDLIATRFNQKKEIVQTDVCLFIEQMKTQGMVIEAKTDE